MAYEIINNAQVNPQRLYALLRLIAYEPEIKEKQILELLQPPSINSNTKAAEEVLNAAVKCELVAGDANGKYKLTFLPEKIRCFEDYRLFMQERLLGITDSNQNNFLLNIFAAWFAVMDEKVLPANNTKRSLAVEFNQALYPDVESRVLNDTKLRGMDDWLMFLGFGWKLIDYYLIPDATKRVEPLLNKIMPLGEEIPFANFMQNLSKFCPELDRGELFEHCRAAVRGTQDQSNQLSLMLSTALRTLHALNQITLIPSFDATDIWQLYPDMTSDLSWVTHIGYQGNGS